MDEFINRMLQINSIVMTPNVVAGIEIESIEYCVRNQLKYGQKMLDYVRRIDELKNQLCLKNKIILLRISNSDDWRNEQWLVQKIRELCI